MPEVFSKSHKKTTHKPKAAVVHKDVHKVFPKFAAQANSNPLAAFAICPPQTRFDTQEAEENIILLLRQHPIINVPWILGTVLLLFAPMLLEVVPLIDFLPPNFQIMTLGLWYFMVLVFIVAQFLHWYFNVYLVTDERIVDIDFYGLNYRDVKVAKIDKIQDVNYKQGGVWASFFNYGDIFIQTAGEGPNARYDFLKVPQPGKVIEILSQLIDEEAVEAFEGRVR